MGRHGPLTSMALGRSPYDDVVMGEGEGDPRAPLQMYDERGRPVNPETKRINRDIIRSHNEVMLVIGVVESENSIDEVRAEQLRRYAHERHDDRVGRNLEWAARVCELGGVWGVGGMRQRILLYREYSNVPFSSLFEIERRLHSPTSLWLHGLPTFVASNMLDFPWLGDRIMRSNLLKTAFTYIQTSLKMWIFLQRTHLLPASASPWLPSWKYFVPFSASSAIPPCPLPSSFSLGSLTRWLGRVALNVTPFLAFWAVNGLWLSAGDVLYEEIYEMLPHPSNPEQTRIPGNGLILQRVSTDIEQRHGPEPPMPPVEAVPVHVQSRAPQDGNAWDPAQVSEQPTPPDHGQNQTSQERSTTPPGRPDPSSTVTPSRPRSHPRRSHAPNTEDFSSDDEATEEVVSATLISFDVENNPDNPDPANDSNIPPGVWSAELRPNPGNDSPLGRDGDDSAVRSREPARVYRDNALTQLPASIAAAILARRASSVLLAGLEASAMREVAWLWCRARGMSTEGLWEPAWLWPFVLGGGARFGFRFDLSAGFSLGSLANLVSLEIVHLLFDAALWGIIPFTVTRYFISDEEWEKTQKEAESGEQQPQQPQQQNIGGAPEVGGAGRS